MRSRSENRTHKTVVMKLRWIVVLLSGMFKLSETCDV